MPRARPRRRKRGFELRQPCAVQLERPLARPTRMAADRFSFYGRGELSGIALILESEIHLWTTSIPHHRRCIVASRLLLSYKTQQHRLRCRQFVTARRSVGLNYHTGNEMGLLLAVLEEIPRHSGHRHSPKRSRPQRGRRTGFKDFRQGAPRRLRTRQWNTGGRPRVPRATSKGDPAAAAGALGAPSAWSSDAEANPDHLLS